jgi:type II secretory ATPase GspE/PulE/Tfp pilus assembly ATPase PilB-like protein
MIVTEKIKEMILRRASPSEVQRATEEEGMVQPRSDGLLMVAEGVTIIEVVLRTVV